MPNRLPLRSNAQITAQLMGVLMALMLGSAVWAQADPGGISSYQLPKRESRLTPHLQGPVDAEAPAVQPSSAPSLKAPPAPSPIASEASPVASNQASAPATQHAGPKASNHHSQSTTPSPLLSPMPSLTPALTPSAIQPPAPTTAPATAPAPLLSGLPQLALAWPWLAGGAGLLLLVVGWALWRRRLRSRIAPTIEIQQPEPTLVEAAAPKPLAPPAPKREPKASAKAKPKSKPAAASLTLVFEAQKMSATLLNTALTYRLTMTNTGKKPLKQLVISGEMIAAHSAMTSADQAADDAADLALCHRQPSLAPGETCEVLGTLRLAIAAITPIRSGDAALFVPLVRLLATADGKPKLARASFVIGEPSPADARLKPFRLELGPRIYAEISQRELA